MLGNTNNYNNLTSTLSRLNNGDSGKLSNQQQFTNTSGAFNFSNNISSNGSDFMSSFGGFQQQLGQRYSMSGNQTMQLLQMFVGVLEELTGSVVNNSNNHNAPTNTQPNGGNQNAVGGKSEGGSGAERAESRTERQEARAERQANRAERQEARAEKQANRAERQEARAERQAARAERQEARAERQAANGASQQGSGVNHGNASSAHYTGRADANSTITPANAVDATDSTSAASGSEAAQTHKSGGCPFMAMESEQGNNSGGAQSDNSANSPANNQNNNPAAGAAGPSGQQGNSGAGGNSVETAPPKPAGHPPVVGGTNGNQPAQGSADTNGNQPAQEPADVDKADNRDIDFSNLSKTERSDIGLDTRERAVIHLWGRQMMSAGEQNGGIYTNVLGADGTGANWGNKDEVALVQELRAKENEQFGTDTGWLLDEAYFEIMKDKTGVDMAARYADRPVNESKGPVVISNDIDAVADRTGISGFEQGVMRLMGHDALMDGEFDGSVLEYTVGNANSLDSNKHSGGNAIDDMAQTLLAQDKADDGEVNGSSIMNETIKTLDRLYA